MSWKPCIFIQGGGAKGAWEAGVLAGLLNSAKTCKPVAIWGTSAGAINALWASTLPETSNSERLIDLWCCLSCRIVVSVLSLVAVFLPWVVIMLIFHTVFIACFIGAILISSTFVQVWKRGCVIRLPGLIPLWIAAPLLPQNLSPARWDIYFCTANVNLENPPQSWDWDTISYFHMGPGSTSAKLNASTSEPPFDPRLAVLASAALPIIFRPLFVGDKAFLDGGLEVNLPAGSILSQGMSGGHCAICIVPTKLADLDPQDHVDYRVLRFLSEMKMKQEKSREKLGDGQNPQGTAGHTRRPILVVCPSQELRSGLLEGLFCRNILRREFEQGRRDSEALLKAMSAFESGADDALQEYLLENRQLPVVAHLAPKAGCWKYWANLKWT
jgi:predicted patatin/cPLA2 family phospholipase